jgi:multidrug efflux pump subunit AcrB
MLEMQSGLAIGLGLAVVAVFLLLMANFQSVRLAIVAIATAPAVVAGVALMLFATRTTLNIQSFIGAIMAIGVAMANAILLVTFADTQRQEGLSARDAAIEGASSRLRAILMTSCAMIAGMLPMALAWGEAGQQNAPLGRAVIGGLIGATLATLFVLPSLFSMIQSGVTAASPSLDPNDPHSAHYAPAADASTAVV